MPAAIEVSHVTKEYRLGTLQGLKQTALNAGRRLLGRAVEERPLFKALDDVSFSVEPGEVVGIIGHNGAGKSTLLKLLARISTPTRGSVKVNGRIAPLIEVGAGFVPDFTGRENVYLNGAILGMRKAEIDRKFDEIVDFAEMAEFIDTPVKRYSSGMQVKLAFAVATSIEAEILIVDEVLAVGDLAFQRKCFDRMEDLIKQHGMTVLLVSHNIRQVERICNRVIMMDHGRVLCDGAAKDVCDLYYEQSDARIATAQLARRMNSITHTAGDIDLVDARITDPTTGLQLEKVQEGQPLSIALRYRISRELQAPVFAAGIHTSDLLYLATHRSEGQLRREVLKPGDYTVVCNIRSFPLLAGTYSVRASVAAGNPRNEHFYGENLLHFQVSPAEIPSSEMRNEGFIALCAEWGINKNPELAQIVTE